MANFMAFVLTDTLVTAELKEKGVENTEEGKSLAKQLPLFAAIFSRRSGNRLSSAVFPAIIAQGIASRRADELRQQADSAPDLVPYYDARGKPFETAKKELEGRGFVVEPKGNTNSNRLKSQTPEFREGMFLGRGATVILEYEGDST